MSLSHAFSLCHVINKVYKKVVGGLGSLLDDDLLKTFNVSHIIIRHVAIKGK